MTDRSRFLRSGDRSVRGTIAGLLGRGGTTVVECRHCGTSVTVGTQTCPACGGDEIVQYTIQ